MAMTQTLTILCSVEIQQVKPMQNKISHHRRFSPLSCRHAAIVLIVAGLGATSGSIEAHAEIVSAKARYDRGLLIVRGKTAEPMQFVSLSRKLVTRSNRVGRFVFRQSRLPQLCSVHLHSEGQQLTIPIKNCPLR